MEFDKSILLDIVYGYEPMTRQLAERIRHFRCEKKLIYEEIPYSLHDGFGSDFALGKELCVKARLFLKEEKNPAWD